MPSFIKMGLVLLVVGAIATALLAVTDQATREPIAKAKLEETRLVLSKVLPTGYDNLPEQDVVQLSDELLNKKKTPVTFYRARKESQLLATAFIVTAPDGYSGNIEVMMGVDTRGAITAAMVVTHAETPGLGDKVIKTNWFDAFKGKTVDNANWKVKKDGGDFDQFSGATVTPRAIVKAMKRGLDFYVANRDRIAAPATPAAAAPAAATTK